MPFALTYGAEVVISVEILKKSPRVHFYQAKSNSEVFLFEKDLLEEAQEAVVIRNAHYKHKVAKYNNRQVKQRLF